MKNLIIIAIFAVTSLTLFSFRNVEEKGINAEITDVKEFKVAAKNFTESSETFPDKFTRWRKSWTDYETIEQMNVSMDDLNNTLEKF